MSELAKTRITKLKLQDGQVRLGYQVQSQRSPDEWLDYKLTSEDAPLPEFLKALEELRAPLLDILELPSSYGERLGVVGLTIKYRAKDAALCASIVAEKALRGTKAILEIKSPSLAETAPESNPNDDKVLSTPAAVAVNEVVEQCHRYLRGERQQGVLFTDTAM